MVLKLFEIQFFTVCNAMKKTTQFEKIWLTRNIFCSARKFIHNQYTVGKEWINANEQKKHWQVFLLKLTEYEKFEREEDFFFAGDLKVKFHFLN